MQFKVAVVGAAGFAGIELVRILCAHPSFSLKIATSDANADTRIADMYPSFAGKTDLAFTHIDMDELSTIDAVFLAVPHTAALGMAPALIAAGVSVIDLSADFRLKDPSIYESWYATDHTAKDLLASAAFGLPEITADELDAARARHEKGEAVLVGCAGCYPTATSLAVIPAIRSGIVDPHAAVIADAISGVTGAGKKATERTHFCFANENVEAYGVATHRHTPEIEQILGIEGRLVFTPHLAPLNRGLLSTVNIPLADAAARSASNAAGSAIDAKAIHDIYVDYFASSPFVEVLPLGRQPRTASVVGTNNAHVGIAYNERVGMLIATCAIDNLGKGAAGQAVQCANIVFGLDQTEGLNGMALPV